VEVTVVGLGKIGLPLAVQFASKRATVTGYDTDERLVALLRDRRNPLPSEPGLEPAVSGAVASGRLKPTSDPRKAGAYADVVLLIVPVDVDDSHHADFGALDAALSALSPHLKRGVLVIVETTVPVGTTRSRVGAQISRTRGWAPGVDFALAFSPERVSSGTVLLDLQRCPKIVGGVDAQSAARAADFYRGVLDADVIVVRDAETAEFSKLAETTYRDVNIALANEFARRGDALGVDVLEAIDVANTQPYSHIHRPGPGVGGHCIPVYPYFLADEGCELIAAARHTNDGMAAYAVARLAAALGGVEGATCVVLGLSYRAGVKEPRHSSAFALAAALAEAGATPYVHDPLFTSEEIRSLGLQPPPEWPLPADALVVQAWHDEYAVLDFSAFPGLRAILDGRGALDRRRVEALGLAYVGIGH
jgi:nucleotide sugar dehydrogenase